MLRKWIPPKHMRRHPRMMLYWFRLQIRRRRPLKRLRCKLFGHGRLYEDHYWSGGYEKCSRCYQTTKVLWRPKVTYVKGN